MVQDVYKTISKYAKLVSELDFLSGETPKIIFRSGGRCYMTLPEADFSDLSETDIMDVTDRSEGEMPAVTALMSSKDLSAMIISEPPYTGICIESHHEIEAVLDDMAQIAGPRIEIVPAEAKAISKALRKASAVMVDSGCLIAAGRTLYEAYIDLLVVEKSAEVTLKAQVTGGVRPLGHAFARHMHRKYKKDYSAEETKLKKEEESAAGEEAFDADPEKVTAGEGINEDKVQGATERTVPDVTLYEQKKREELVLYGRALASAGLVQGTWGNLSMRLDSNTMICTPSGLDYDRLRAEDMVKVNISDLKYEGKHKPTSEKSLHAGIYRKFPEAGAVIHTHSKYVSIFAASEMPLQVEDMGKIARVGEMIGISRYALAGTNKLTRYALNAMKNAPGCILSHHGMVAYGSDMKEAFDNAEAIEEAAREYIDKRWDS